MTHHQQHEIEALRILSEADRTPDELVELIAVPGVDAGQVLDEIIERGYARLDDPYVIITGAGLRRLAQIEGTY